MFSKRSYCAEGQRSEQLTEIPFIYIALIVFNDHGVSGQVDFTPTDRGHTAFSYEN